MLNRIIEFSIKNKLIITLFVLGLIGYGSYQVTRLPVDAVPDITDNQVQVITVVPALGAPDVERLITFPIEQANSNIPGLVEIRSFSRFGLSLVTIVFDDNVDVYWARQQVAERLLRVQDELPKGMGQPFLAPVTTGLGEIYQYVVRPKEGYEKKYNATELRTIQDWIIRRQLLGVEGVADVSSFGGYLKQYEVAINTAKLASYGVTVNDIFSALENNNANTGGAYIEKGPAVLYIRTEGLAESIADIESIPVKQTQGGIPVFIKDVAEVRIGSAVRYGAMCYNDKGEVSGAVVMMLKGASSGKVIKEIKKRVAQIQKTLPEGVVIEPFLDRTKMVNNAIGTVEKNLLEGALIVVFVLVLFLGNMRAGLLVASIIPLSMLFAVIMMNMFGVSGNLMSLGALDFGLIVDGAVIIVEAVMHRLHHSARFRNVTQLTQAEMNDEVKTSASKMMNSAVFGQIIILIVYLPILTLQGIEGKMFKPMAQTVAFALAGAFLLSLTYIPMMSSVVISKKVSHKPNISDRMLDRLAENYRRVLTKVLGFPKLVISVAAGLFVVALVVLSSLGGEFIPQLEEGDFAADTRVLTGSNLHTTIDGTQKASAILLDRFPEIEKVVTKIGSGEIPTDPMPMEASDLMIILKDKKEWTTAQTFPELADTMSAAIAEVPGLTTGFQYPVQMRFNELMTGAKQDVVCKIFGEDLDTLAHYAEQLGRLATGIEGAKDIYVETVTGLPQIVIEYNRAAIAAYGLDIETINNVIHTAFGGKSTGMLFERERRFDIVVRLAGDRQKNLNDVAGLLIPTPSGAQVPLNQLATVQIKEGPNQIQREDAKRRIIVGFNVRGRDVQTIVHELQKKAEGITLPPGYYITYGGAFENLEAAQARLAIVVPLALGLIFLMLYFAFGSLKHGLIIYSAIPLSAIGGVFALALRGMPFSISAGVGFIALFGVAVLNGIVLISEFRKLKADGMTNLKDIVLQGATTRLRPVLMTASVASLGFLPMALSHSAGAEVQRPLATVVIGGLITATFLTLFLLPVLFVVFEQVKFRAKRSATVMLLLVLLPAGVHAQQDISLQAAIDSALTNNLSIKSKRLTAEQYRKMAGTAWDIGRTSVAAEWGNINSAYSDTRYSVSHTISFPAVYARQNVLMKAEWRAAEIQLKSREKELVKQVSQTYCDMNTLMQKRRLLQYADSVYEEFYKKAELRYNLGASDILEKSTAENQRGQIYLQLQQLEADIIALQLRFAYLLQTDNIFVPQDNLLKLPAPVVSAEPADNHPDIQYLLQQQKMATAQLRLEKVKLLPEITGGYYNQSYSGWQKVDNIERFYTQNDRFGSGLIGISVPISVFSQTARLKALSLNRAATEMSYKDGQQALVLRHRQTLTEYRKNVAAVAYYEGRGLTNADDVLNAARDKYLQGDINYLEYAMLINQAVAIKSGYYDALNELNQSITELNYLSNK